MASTTLLAPQIKVRLVFDPITPELSVDAQKGHGYTIDDDGNIRRWQAIPEGQQGRVEFGLPVPASEAGTKTAALEFAGARIAESQAEFFNSIPVLDSGGQFIGTTAFSVSHDATAGTLTLWEGPYLDQFVPLEGWMYQVGVLFNGTEVWLDPRIYSKGDLGDEDS